MELYDALAGDWYRLIDPPGDHEDEAKAYGDALRGAVPDATTLLELGSGGGHNALYLKSRFACTLSDLSEAMLTLSRALNPECEHVSGDMRTIRLDRTFDTVLIHDAIGYMTTVADLRAALLTAHTHLRPGGAALIAPDGFRETFCDYSQLHQADEEARSLRCLEWFWDPDPDDDTAMVEFAFLLREGAEVRIHHDRHVVGHFHRSRWMALFEEVGFAVQVMTREVPPDGPYTSDVFLCRRPEE